MIVGPMIIVIGLSLRQLRLVILQLQLKMWHHGKLFSSGVTFLTIILVAVKAKGFPKIIPFLFRCCGYIMALIVGMVDFSLFEGIRFSHYLNFK